MAKRRIELGNQVRDRISGFTGIANSRVEFFNKCVRIEIASQQLTKDGALIEGRYFDEVQVEYVGPGLLKPDKEFTGGGNDPSPRVMPTH